MSKIRSGWSMMEFLALFVIPAVALTLTELSDNANDYFVFKLHRDLVTMSMEFSQMEQKFNNSQVRVSALEAEVRRLKMKTASDTKVFQGACSFCKTRLEDLEAGFLSEKWRSSRVNKAVEKLKNRLAAVTRLDQTVGTVQDRLQTMTQLDETVESIQDRLQTMTQLAETVESIQDRLQTMTQLAETLESIQDRLHDVAHQQAVFDEFIQRVSNYTTRIEGMEHREQTRWYVRGRRVRGDDTVSRADCSPGIVVECRCSHESKTCDGVAVQGRNCYAQKSGYRHGSSEIWAKAVCEDAGRYQVITSPVHGFNGNPLAKCPKGTKVTTCWLRNWWMHENYIGTIKDINNNTCQPEPGCEKHKECSIQALCKAI